MTELLNFSDVLKNTDPRKRVCLLGNGFSIACRPDIFSYRALLDQLKDALVGEVRDRIIGAFDSLATCDFGQVLSALGNAISLGAHYGVSDEQLGHMEEDLLTVREALAELLASKHPEGPNKLDEAERKLCAQFLANFKKVYSLNYDLLLYWTVLNGGLECSFSDGFRNADDDPDEQLDYVVWQLGNEKSTALYYLHGELHLFAHGGVLRKLTWSRTNVPLKSQIRKALREQRFPLFVAEGDAASKLAKIVSHAYLARAYRSFQELHGDLVVYGCSLAASDEHIVKALRENRHLKSIHVSLYKDPNADPNRKIRAACEALRDANNAERKPGDPQLAVHFFDAESAEVWTKRPPKTPKRPTPREKK